MRNFKKIYTLILLMSFVFVGDNLYAQKRTTSEKAVVVNKNNRIPSKQVTYKKPRKKIVSVRTLPQKTRIVHNGTNYYYSNHKFYTYSKGNYITIQPKVGFRIQTLPTGYIRVKHLNRNYFWFNGIFYIQVDNQYEVVDPEIGTIIYELPSEYERVEIDNNTYYEFGNVLYEKV